MMILLQQGRIIPHDRATRVAEGATRSIGFSRVGGSKGVRGLKLNEPIGTSSLTDEDYLFAGTQLEWEDGQTGSLSIDFTATQNSEHEEGKALFYNVTFDEDQTSDYRLRVYLYEDDPSTTDTDGDGIPDIVDADLDDDGVVNCSIASLMTHQNTETRMVTVLAITQTRFLITGMKAKILTTMVSEIMRITTTITTG